MINQKSNRKKLKTIAILSAITICSSIALGTVESKARVSFLKSLTFSPRSFKLSLPSLKMPKIKMLKIKVPKIELVNPFSGFWGRVKGIFAGNKVKTNKSEQPSATPSAPPLDDDLDQLAADVAYSTRVTNNGILNPNFSDMEFMSRSGGLIPTAPPAE